MPYLPLMYCNPQMIWVSGFVLQSDAMVAILLPGSDWGIPYAPLDLFSAVCRQLDSFSHKARRQLYSVSFAQPYLLNITLWAIPLAVEGLGFGAGGAVEV